MLDTAERRGIEREITGLLRELDEFETGAETFVEDELLIAQTGRVAARLDATVKSLRSIGGGSPPRLE
jgi:hypothetical protein